MMKLLLPYAYDSNGNLVHIDNAQNNKSNPKVAFLFCSRKRFRTMVLLPPCLQIASRGSLCQVPLPDSHSQ